MANRLKELREASNLKVKDVADAIGVGPRNIYRWELGPEAKWGTGIPDEHKVALARFLLTSVPYLMGWVDPGNGSDGDNGEQRDAA